MEMRSDAESCGVCSSEVRAHDTDKSPENREGGELRREGIFLAVSAATALTAALWERRSLGALPGAGPWILFLAAYLAAGWNVILGAVRNVLRGRPFDELFLMTLSTAGAFVIDHPEEAVGVMIFYKIGEMFQESAAAKSRRSIRAVLALRPDSARVLWGGVEVMVSPDAVEVGELILVRPGERLPLDGVVEAGEGWLDTSALTGESKPRRAKPGVEVLGGAIAREGALTVRVSRPASQSYAARIVDLVENAAHAKARTERFITRFARWYTPAVVTLALIIAFLPPLLSSAQSLSAWVYRALVMLVISCPCALVLSVPLGYFAGLGGAAKRGILVKGSQPFEALAEARTVVFDKTGTLTAGDFSVRAIRPAQGRTEAEVLTLAAEAEAGSNHPIAMAIRKAFELSDGVAGVSGSPTEAAAAYREIPGKGVVARKGSQTIAAGTAALLESEGVAAPPDAGSLGGTTVLVAENGSYAGEIVLGDSLKPDAAQALEDLRAQGIRRLVLLTGDAPGPAREAAEALGIKEVHSGLLPHEKLDRLEAILSEESSGKGRTVFVGDGINDTPVLARADVGMAMGAGADAALETADVVLMTGEPGRVAEAIRRARGTRRIVLQNIVFALAFKLAFLALGAAGLANMWEAVVADVGVALLAVLNSTRALR